MDSRYGTRAGAYVGPEETDLVFTDARGGVLRRGNFRRGAVSRPSVSVMGVNRLPPILAADISPGGAKRARTADPLLAKQVLFQLSYSPRKPQVRRPSAQILVCSPAEIGDGVAIRSAALVKYLLLGRCYRAQ